MAPNLQRDLTHFKSGQKINYLQTNWLNRGALTTTPLPYKDCSKLHRHLKDNKNVNTNFLRLHKFIWWFLEIGKMINPYCIFPPAIFAVHLVCWSKSYYSIFCKSILVFASFWDKRGKKEEKKRRNDLKRPKKNAYSQTLVDS